MRVKNSINDHATSAVVPVDEPLWERDAVAFEDKLEEWRRRDWVAWLSEHLTFPFRAERINDEDDAYFTDSAEREPFRLGHTVNVLKVELEDDQYGIIVKVSEGRKRRYVPLCDLGVPNKGAPDYWPIREYLSWFANRY
uniref:Uncharacterized protein n=1 Tax=Geobacter metallireducens TaxID=28232 RepID=A0A831U414_GEOME